MWRTTKTDECERLYQPVEHDVVGEEGGQQQLDQPDGQPQHEQHDGAEHHHGQDEAPQVPVDGQVDHLLHRVEVGVVEVPQEPQHSGPQHLREQTKRLKEGSNLSF